MKKTLIVVFSISAILLAIGAYVKHSQGVTLDNTWNPPPASISGETWLMSSPPIIIRDSDWLWDEEIQKIDNKFPKPLNISLQPTNEPDQVPVSNNTSNIYFNSSANGSIQISNKSDFTLSGKVGPTIQSIEIINSRDNISRLIEDFRKTDFSINLTDMKIWKNVYLLRAYSKNNKIYERFFILYYYPLKTEPEKFQAVKDLSSKNFSEYEQCGPFYEKITPENNKPTWIFMPNQYGKNTQKLSLDSGINFIYTQTELPPVDGEFWGLKGSITFEDEQIGKTYTPFEVSLWCGDFAGHNIVKISDDEYLLSTSGWHEGEPSEYYFNRKKKNFLSIYEIIKKIDGNKTYGIFGVEVDDKNIVLIENRYCCDDVFSLYGFEKIYFSKEGEFIKRENISQTPVFGTPVDRAQSDNLSSKDYWYSLSIYNESEGNKEYPVTNPKLINDFLIKHAECFEKENGFVCGGKIKYEFEIDKKWNARIKNIVKSN